MSENLFYLRKDFKILNTNLIYLDNAATSLKPNQVINKINEYYNCCPANVHRGNHQLSLKASVVYEEAHEKIAKFVNSKPTEVIFTLNSTDAINQVMYVLYNSNYFKKNDEIVVSIMEHHANFVPWQYLAKKLGLVLKVVNVKNDFTLDMDDFKKKISKKTKLVAITHVSNTVGTIINVKEITTIAKKYNSLVLIDGSQAAPHLKINFKEINCDFYVFTGHKMLGPTGIGVLLAKEKLLLKLEPFRFGGDMISKVTTKKSEWNVLPYKYEAGTPNIAGVFGLSAAVDYLKDVGLKNIKENDQQLLKYSIEKLETINNLKMYNNKNIKKQAPIILFDLKNIGCRELSSSLDIYSNIATRAGVHCAQPFVTKLNKDGLSRASLYFYNTYKEIDVLTETIKKIDQIINK
jgi:cysteine desulfurase / selenocysteine lyase